MLFRSNSINSTSVALGFNASIPGSAVTPTVTWTAHAANSYRSGAQLYEHTVIADILIDGSTINTTYNLVVSVVTGTLLGTSDKYLTFTGSYNATLVGTIN